MNNSFEPDRLEDISCIQSYFISYLTTSGVKKEDLSKEFFKLCESIRQGKESKELRKMTIHTLLANDYHQDKIAKLLNVSIRTVGRDVKEIADSLHTPRFWKRGLLRDGKLREKKMSMADIFEKIMENVKNDKSGKYALFVMSLLKGKMSDGVQN